MSPIPPDARPVVVQPTGVGRFQQRAVIGAHELILDEPVAQGGGDTGPTPYDMILAALGACTSITLRLYADRKAMPLEDVKVSMTHRRIHAEDCAECEVKQGMLDEVAVAITLVGPLSDADRMRLLQIAEMCPVHRTLTGRMRLVTTLEPGSALS